MSEQGAAEVPSEVPSDKYEWERRFLRSDLSAMQRLVLLVLASRMNPDGSRCYPPLEDSVNEETGRTKPGLITLTGLSRSGLLKAIRDLKESGWLRVEKGRRGRASRYFMSAPDGLSVHHVDRNVHHVDLNSPPRRPHQTTDQPNHQSREMAPTGEVARGGRMPRGPRKVEALPAGEDVLMLDDSESDDLLDLATVALAHDYLSGERAEREQTIASKVGCSSERARELLDWRENTSEISTTDPDFDVPQVVDLVSGLKTHPAQITAPLVAALTRQARDLWPDPKSRWTGLDRASVWDSKPWINDPAKLLPGRLRSVAAKMIAEEAAS